MKIMYIIPSLKRDGPNNQVQYLLRNIPKDDNDVLVVSLGKDRCEDRRFHNLGIEIIYCATGIKDVLINNTRSLYNIINRYKPDIVQTYGIRPDTSLNVRKLKCKLISVVRCSIKQCYKADYGKVVGTLVALFHSSKLKDGRIIIACSDAVAKYNKEEISVNTDFVVRNAIETEYRRLSLKERAEKRQLLGIYNTDVVLVSTGYLTKAKDPILIAEALREINSTNENYRLKAVFLGEGPLRRRLEAYNDDNIILAGHVSNVSEWLDISDIYVSASHFEGMPNAALEGMRSSLPVLLSDIPSHVEIIRSSSEYVGELFKVSDRKSIVEAFYKLKTHDFSKVGQNSSRLITRAYSSDRLADQHMKIYKKLGSGQLYLTNKSSKLY